MRIGIVSDVHGNAFGLSRALDLMGPVDLLLCAGDVVEEHRFSNEAVEILRDRDARCVLGNHDIGLLGPHGQRARQSVGVRPDLVEWLASHSLSLELDVAGSRLLMTHASPFAPHNHYVTRHSPELRRFHDLEADYVVIGHTHAQMVERVGRATVINPGSVGQARDPSNGKRLSYAVLDVATGDLQIDNYEAARLSGVGGMQHP